MANNWREILKQSPEQTFDYRLADKKITENFISREDFEKFKKSIPEETEFDFSNHEEISADTGEEAGA